MEKNTGRQFDKLNANLRAMTHAHLINSDNYRTYGTFAEIGAGLETSRYFFQAGKASTTIAKAMSAYAKEASDVIYLDNDYLACLSPQVELHPDGRKTLKQADSSLPYTNRFRVMRMLRTEYAHLVERFANGAFAAGIDDDRRRMKDDSRDFPAFFVYANSVAVSNWGRDADRCHGWVGARVQLRRPKGRLLTWESAKTGPYVDILAHVVMLEDSREEQMDTLGIFGVQMLDAAIKYSDGSIENRDGLLDAMMGNIEPSRLRIDVVDVSEGTYPAMSVRLDELYTSTKLAFDMVDRRLTHSVLLSASVAPELAGIRGPIIGVIQTKGEFDLIFPANHQRVPQRYLSRSDVLVHELPINEHGHFDKAKMAAVCSVNWAGPDEYLNHPKHMFVCPIGSCKEKQDLKFFAIANDFLDTSANSTHSLLLVRYNDPGWLAEHLSRLTYDGSRVHLCFSSARFRERLTTPSGVWATRDRWIDWTASDERHDATIRRNKLKGTRIWSESSLDFLLRVIQRPTTRDGRPSCIIRVAAWNPGKDTAGIEASLAKMLGFMTECHKLIILPL